MVRSADHRKWNSTPAAGYRPMHVAEEYMLYILMRFKHFMDLAGIFQQPDAVETGNPDIKRRMVHEEVYRSIVSRFELGLEPFSAFAAIATPVPPLLDGV